jgi:uncharacterized protein
MALVYNFRYPVISVFILTIMVSGCVGQSPPATHYLLKAIEKTSDSKEQPAGELKPLRVQVGPVMFPEYLDRPQMVFLSSDHKVSIDSFNRWAEPLAENFKRVVVENLGLLLNSDFVQSYTFKKTTGIDYRIRIDVKRFDATPGREVVLIAGWTVYSGEDQSLLLEKRFDIRKPISTDSASEMVAVLNEAVNDFTLEIAETINKETPAY